VIPLDLDLALSLTPANVSPTRRLLESKLAGVLDDDDAVFRVAMTAHELLENAAKYARDGRARLQLQVVPQADRAHVTVILRNSSTREHIEQLRDWFQEMQGEGDSLAHYFALMRRNALLGSISRLGLARVRAEGEMTLAISIDGEDVTIVASTIVRGTPRHGV
jgi:two-component sensor histidine kinase